MVDKVPVSTESGDKHAPAPTGPEHPLTLFQHRMSQLFDDFFGNWNLPSLDGGRDWLGGFNPRMDVTDDGRQLKVTVELPGLDEKDIEVTLTDNLLTIKGEKREESEEKGKDWLRHERSYGSFRRSLRLGREIDAGKVKASFRNGVLHLVLPKTAAAQEQVHKIPIHS
jgi:HSP20 family protein